jgi:hypothetical protein
MNTTMGTEVSNELEAMQHVTRALARLADNQSRVRVLQWAADHVRRAQEATPRATAKAAAGDPAVSIDGLSELFPSLGRTRRQERDYGDDLSVELPDDGPQEASAEPLDALIRGLAADLAQFATAYQHA